MNLKKDSEASGEQMTLFSLEASRNYASPTAKQEKDLAKKTNAIYGRKCLEQFERFNHVGSWAKTFSALLIGQEGWYSRRCKLTWKIKGTKYNRIYFQLQPSTLPTEGTEFGLLPTVTTQETPHYEAQITETGRRKASNGNTHSLNLADHAIRGLLPTPKVGGKEGYETRAKRQGHEKAISHLEAFVEYHMLPTPATRDYKGARSSEALSKSGRNQTNNLPDAFHQPGKTSQLNPQFVMEMMGFPPNWTLLPFLNGEMNQSKPEATP